MQNVAQDKPVSIYIPYTFLVEGNEKLPHDADGCQADYTGVEE